jgi:hypothetical protein
MKIGEKTRLFQLTCGFFHQRKPDFQPTSFYFLMGTECNCHKDDHNEGTYSIAGFGKYEGG